MHKNENLFYLYYSTFFEKVKYFLQILLKAVYAVTMRI